MFWKIKFLYVANIPKNLIFILKLKKKNNLTGYSNKKKGPTR